MEYDLIIVGSGSVGAAAGFYATQAGMKVLMIDSAMPPHKGASHHGQTRIIRHAYGEGERYVPLVLRAQALWEQLAELTGQRVFHPCGVLNLGPAESAFLANVRRSAETYGLPIELLGPDQVQARWPVFSVPDGFIGLFEPRSGVLQCEQAIEGYIRLAREAGCAQLFNCPVTEVTPLEQGMRITTPEGAFTARKVVISAGTWVKALLPSLPVQPVRKVFSWHQADGRYSEENRFPAFTAEMAENEHYYGFPAGKEGLKLGKHQGGQPISAPEQRKPFGTVAEDGTEVFRFLRRFLPGVGVCLHGEACTYDMSPDEDFIIDTLPGCPQAMVITGLSGHGFKFASVLGEIASLFADDQPVPFDLTPFSLARFA